MDVPSQQHKEDPTILTTESLLREIKHAQELTNARFDAVELQFILKDRAITAALDAAEKAVTKSEIANEKQIDRILEMIGASDRARETQIKDLKERLDRGDSGGAGAGRNQTWMLIALAIGLIGTIIGIVSQLRAH